MRDNAHYRKTAKVIFFFVTCLEACYGILRNNPNLKWDLEAQYSVRGCGERCTVRRCPGTELRHSRSVMEVGGGGERGGKDFCCPEAACSFLVNVTREDVGFLYFSVI